MEYEKLDEIKIQFEQNRENFMKFREQYPMEMVEKYTDEDLRRLILEFVKLMIPEREIQGKYIKELEKTHPHFMKK